MPAAMAATSTVIPPSTDMDATLRRLTGGLQPDALLLGGHAQGQASTLTRQRARPRGTRWAGARALPILRCTRCVHGRARRPRAREDRHRLGGRTPEPGASLAH